MLKYNLGALQRYFATLYSGGKVPETRKSAQLKYLLSVRNNDTVRISSLKHSKLFTNNYTRSVCVFPLKHSQGQQVMAISKLRLSNNQNCWQKNDGVCSWPRWNIKKWRQPTPVSAFHPYFVYDYCFRWCRWCHCCCTLPIVFKDTHIAIDVT